MSPGPDISTTDRLRREIDLGHGSDKVPFPDPAAAPLGTDDEAAGTPPSADSVRAAARTEIDGGIEATPAVTDESGRRIDGTSLRPGPMVGPLLAVLVAAAVVVIVLLILF